MEHENLTSGLIYELNRACQSLRDGDTCADEPECFGIGWCEDAWLIAGIRSKGIQNEGEEIRQRAKGSAHELLITARYRYTFCRDMPEKYLSMVEGLRAELRIIGGWRVVLIYDDIDSVLWWDIGTLGYVARDIRYYIAGKLTVSEYGAAIVKHRAIFKEIEERISCAGESRLRG